MRRLKFDFWAPVLPFPATSQFSEALVTLRLRSLTPVIKTFDKKRI